jgi:hypothetical protein
MDLLDYYYSEMLYIEEPDFRYNLTWDESEALYIFN